MIYLIFEVLTILAYMLNGYLGLIMSSIMFCFVWLDRKNIFENKIIISMILSVPFYNIGVLGNNMHHMFSWYNIFLIIYIIILIIKFFKKEYKISKRLSFFMGILLSLMCINMCLEKNIFASVTDFLQIVIMLISIFATYQAKETFIKKLNNQDIENWINKINITIIAMAICTVIQFVIYKTTKNTIGIMTMFPGRTTYDLLFKGYSVLSLVLGIGIIININNIVLKKGKKNIDIINVILCIIAIIINSSRTGLFAALIIVMYIILSNFLKNYNFLKMNKKQLIKGIVFIISVITMILVIFLAMQISRKSENIFSDNGRITTYVNAIKTIFKSFKNFFIGNGLSPDSYDFMLPHNAILETAMKLGIIFTSIIVYLFVILLKFINNNKYIKYIIWHILISSMLITGFHEMSFIILFIVISIVSTNIYNYSKIIEEEKERK